MGFRVMVRILTSNIAFLARRVIAIDTENVEKAYKDG